MSLNEEDRNWITAELAKGRADSERLFATELAKGRADSERLFATELAKGRTDFERLFSAELAKVRIDIEHVETSLLTEFHKWASPMEMRVRSHSAALRAMDIEVVPSPSGLEG